VDREAWPAGEAPRSIAYFCNALAALSEPAAAPDPAFTVAAEATVKANAIAFLRRWGRHLWPASTNAATGEFCWDLLAGGGTATGVARFDSQFWRANVDPSERYVLSLPGTGRHRIKPGETGFDNLVIAGDWTDCGLNAGCVEAAVMSGRLAAHAVSGTPLLEDIVGYPRS
jgi:Flavin containing amine oxidoreductase